jgi:hypothetical protein
VIISPERGRTVEIGKRLLALADHPRDVQWVTWPAPGGFSIPLELFAKFDSDDLATGGVLKKPLAIGEDHPPPYEVPQPKRRRRNKETSTDNNTSEEE